MSTVGWLYISALKGVDLKIKGITSSPAIRFQLDYIKKTTKPDKRNKVNPTFTEVFEFELLEHHSSIKIEVLGKAMSDEHCFGRSDIDLKEVKHKRKAEYWVQIYHPTKKKEYGKVLVKMEYITDHEKRVNDGELEVKQNTRPVQRPPMTRPSVQQLPVVNGQYPPRGPPQQYPHYSQPPFDPYGRPMPYGRPPSPYQRPIDPQYQRPQEFARPPPNFRPGPPSDYSGSEHDSYGYNDPYYARPPPQRPYEHGYGPPIQYYPDPRMQQRPPQPYLDPRMQQRPPQPYPDGYGYPPLNTPRPRPPPQHHRPILQQRPSFQPPQGGSKYYRPPPEDDDSQMSLPRPSYTPGSNNPYRSRPQ